MVRGRPSRFGKTKKARSTVSPDSRSPEPKALLSADAIARSRRTDLHLAVVAPVGIRRDSFEAALDRVLKPFGYELEMIRLSELIEDFRGVTFDKSSENARLRTAMDAGTELRDRVGADVLARAALLEVAGRRAQRAKSLNAAPVAYVFWSLKHSQEVATLRLVYGGAFHLIALFASEEERVKELENRKGITRGDAEGHVARDREEPGRRRGQQTRDTFHRADVFLPWGSKQDKAGLKRFVELLFGRPDLTPTEDEHRMFLAYGSAVRSGELSRQVGATLVSEGGDVLALGSNDVPRRGGGLYWPSEGDDRDIVRKEDSNVRVRRELLADVAAQVVGKPDEGLAHKLGQTKLKQITEYGRAVHAEMEALLACARGGRSSRKATLYVTTFPCHNCARHIIAAGVARVVYVEPYPKSRALELHDKDLVETAPSAMADDGDDRVRFQPYLGVGPRRFLDYFSMHLGDGYALERMDDEGRLAEWDPSKVAPRVQGPTEYIEAREQSLGAEVEPMLDRRREDR
jgi:deoxycytidylate deaminase